MINGDGDNGDNIKNDNVKLSNDNVVDNSAKENQNLIPCTLCQRKFLSDRLVSFFYFSYLNLDIFIIFFPTFETKNLDDLKYKSINPRERERGGRDKV